MLRLPKPLTPPKALPLPPPAEKPLIIIDAGHGGQDPGARGANGTYEKTIVLAVAHELRKQLEDSGKYKVKMTRETDVFIPLRGRVNFARKHNGDLFISLHADSIQNSQVTGASVYTLSDKASDKETQKLADRENKSDLIAGVDLSTQEDDVADILIDLAARDTMNQSKFLANTVVSSLQNNGIRTLSTAHRSAGFAVLKAMDIPSILVEMGYLTNRSEVERLSSPQHRRKIAATLKSSIDTYFQKTSK
jgi:N-acetylmuramoyl-L-alanine amidase